MKNAIYITPKHSFREKLIILLFSFSKNIYRKTIKRYTKDWDISIYKLSKYEIGTLGKDLALFLQANQFSLEPKFEKHDIYHILTGYPTTVIGEICLSVFNVANGKRSIYTVGVALIGAAIMFDSFSVFKKAFHRGKNARSYSKWKFEYLLKENTCELKNYIFKKDNNLELFI